MGEWGWSILLIVAFTLVGAFFAAAETSLVALRESQARRLAERGKRGRRLAALVADPNRFLAAVQVGITLAGFLAAGYGAAQIAPSIEPWLVSLGLSPEAAGTVAFLGVTVVIAYFTLVVGELVPKRLALAKVEPVALAVASPISVVATMFRPFIRLLSLSTNLVIRAFGIREESTRDVMTGEELRGIVAMHEGLTHEERELIDEVFEAGDRELREVMVPRTEVEFLDGGMTVQQATEVALSLPHTRYPVIRGTPDDVIGFVHLRDISAAAISLRTSITLASLAREVTMYPGTKRVIPALTEMRHEGHHLAIVLDEYGGTAGIVTLEDLVEELVGEIRDEYDEAADERVDAAGTPELDGFTNLEDFEELTGVTLPEGPYETVAGFIIATTGALPELGAAVEVDGRVLRVAEVEGRRISRVTVEPVADVPGEEGRGPADAPDDGPAATSARMGAP